VYHLTDAERNRKSLQAMALPSVRGNTLLRALKVSLGIGASYYLLVFLAIALLRLNYPYELEWMESQTVDIIRWILFGRGLYTAPSVEFISPIYNPLYFVLSAGLAKLVGVGFLAPRLISFLSALGSFLTIFLLVRRETGQTFAALLAVGLFAATFRMTGAWLDVARVDSLFLFLTLLAAYMVRRFPGVRGAGLSALVLVLAYATKQSTLLLIACLAGYYLLQDRKAAAVFGLVALATGLPFHLYSALTTDGWFVFYTVGMVGQHDMLIDRNRFVLEDIARMGWMGLLGVAFLVGLANLGRQRWLFYCAVSVGMLGMAYLGRINSGGYDNVLLPATAALAILSGLVLSAALKRGSPEFAGLTLLICIVQLVVLIYDPIEQVPTAADRAAGDELIETIRSFVGEVYIPSHTYYAAMAGKEQTHAHWTAVGGVAGVLYTNQAAVRGSATEEPRARFRQELAEAISAGKYEVIILDDPRERRAMRFWGELLEKNYKQEGSVFSDMYDGDFWPRTGSRTRPQYIYVRQNKALAADRL
jgi:hypothetical protein